MGFYLHFLVSVRSNWRDVFFFVFGLDWMCKNPHPQVLVLLKKILWAEISVLLHQ